MVLRLCQLKSLLLPLLLLSSCSWKSKKYDSNELITMFQAGWFKAHEEHSLVGLDGAPLAHLFYDVHPEFSGDLKNVNVVITTPEGSPHKYLLDLMSGQRHFEHSYCKQSDVWDQEGGSFNRPNYSIGHIPRFLDQLGGPQKVIVYSDPKKVSKNLGFNFFRVRLVGAFVEKTCPDGNCTEKSQWFSRLVFIGVDVDEKRFEGIKELNHFLKKVDWPHTKAMLENIDGRNFASGTVSPYIKVGSPLTFTESMAFFKRHSIAMTDKEVKKIRTGCHSLYDRLWTEVGEVRPEDKAALDMKSLNEKIKLRRDLFSKRVPVGFSERFKIFIRKYYDEAATCAKFVYAGNLNKNPEKFWFLSFINLFIRMHKDGLYFDCRHKSWQRNIFDNRGKAIYDLKRDMDFCTDKDFDLAMSYLPTFLEGLKSGYAEYYRYIDYDNHVFGTHNKMYTWIKMPSKYFECSEDPNIKIKKEIIRVFPDDTKWKERKVRDFETDMKIIY